MIKTMRVSSLAQEEPAEETRAELDSHTDTCVVGKHALVVHDFDRPVNVTGYDPSEGTVAKGLRTVAAALAYDDPKSGETKIIMLNQAILIPHLDVHLLCPMQLRMNDVKLCEEPKFLVDNPNDLMHALSIPPSEGSGEGLHIPLSLHGVTSYFPVCRPMTEEWEECEQYEATYECTDWDPHSSTFNEQEESMTDPQGLVYDCDALGSRDKGT